MLEKIRYPDVTVELIGHNGNAFVVLGTVQLALRRADVPEDEISKFFTDATSGDYDHLLRTVMAWVNIN